MPLVESRCKESPQRPRLSADEACPNENHRNDNDDLFRLPCNMTWNHLSYSHFNRVRSWPTVRYCSQVYHCLTMRARATLASVTAENFVDQQSSLELPRNTNKLSACSRPNKVQALRGRHHQCCKRARTHRFVGLRMRFTLTLSWMSLERLTDIAAISTSSEQATFTHHIDTNGQRRLLTLEVEYTSEFLRRNTSILADARTTVRHEPGRDVANTDSCRLTDCGDLRFDCSVQLVHHHGLQVARQLDFAHHILDSATPAFLHAVKWG